MSFLTFHISMFFSASFCCGAWEDILWLAAVDSVLGEEVGKMRKYSRPGEQRAFCTVESTRFGEKGVDR